jgi:nucleolar pre-ribosomal-associated protein 1
MASERPSKRARLDKEPLHSFSSADQIIACLENANTEDACIHAVTCISVQLRVNSGEVISPKDNRLYLVCQWALLDLGFKRLLDIYNYATHRRSSLYSLLPSLLCSIFSLLNAHYTNHHHGLVLLRTLISPLWMRKFTTSLTAGAQYDVILHTLRLLNVMSAFSGGSERAALLDSSNWDIKCFFKLLNMRRKSQTQGHPLRNPDIRTLTLMYILSFISTDSLPSLKIHFLTNHSATFSSIFKELFNDSYDVVRFVLETCWTSIWADVRISRSLKISVFSENTVAHVRLRFRLLFSF